MSRLHGGSHRRRGVAVAIAAALLFGSAPATQGATDAGQFSYWRTGLAPLVGSHTWILQGQKLAGGGCQYTYPDQEAAIPAGGWTLRSIAIDMTSCRKLMEEGTPASPLTRDSAMSPLQSKALDVVLGSGGPGAAASSTKGAWQQVNWYDIAGLRLNYDVTQVNWTYNGTIVQSGNAVGYWWWFTATHWNLGPYDVTQLLGPGSSYLRGETVAVFWNNWFCPGPTVYIDIYYNRVWGHPNGTATRAQSSASINECAPLHVGINSAYGQF